MSNELYLFVTRACRLTKMLLLVAVLHSLPLHAQQSAGVVLQHCNDCPKMVVVGAGRFEMGAADDEIFSGTGESPYGSRGAGTANGIASPHHSVRLSRAFALGQHEVTYAQFATFVAQSGYDPGLTGCTLVDAGADPSVFSRDTTVSWQIIKGRSWKYPLWPNVSDNNPVTCVTWDDAQAYVAWLRARTGRAYRLPSEAEWEFAARAGSTGVWFWGDAAQACRYANVADRSFLKQRRRSAKADNHFDCDDGFAFAAPAMSFMPNAWQLYDLIGNVAEWTADCWHPDYHGAPADGSVWSSAKCMQRVVRGDSGTLHLDWTHVAFRAPQAAGEYRANVLGFRVALDL